MKQFEFKTKLNVGKSCHVLANSIEDAREQLIKEAEDQICDGFILGRVIIDYSLEIEFIKEVKNDK